MIAEAAQSQTEMGKNIQEMLLRGEAVSEELAAKLIEEKINSPEVLHHGISLICIFVSFKTQEICVFHQVLSQQHRPYPDCRLLFGRFSLFV